MAKNGLNLNNFQSKKLLQTNCFDHLQSEWSIYHFHLSLKLEKKTNFVKRSNTILFAYIKDDLIAFLGIDTHKKGLFGDSKWVKIIHDNFPELIEQYKDKRIRNVIPKHNPIEVQTLWDKGYTTGMTQIGDAVYHNPGIGRSTSGHSLIVVKYCDQVVRWLKNIENEILEYKDLLCNLLSIPDITTIKIEVHETGLLIIESISKYSLLKFPEIFDKNKLLNGKNCKL